MKTWEKTPEMRLVFVCSGNTCRSPLAICAWRLAVQEISARGGCKRAAAFHLADIEVTSAGLCASPGAPAAPAAQIVARSWGEDLSDHRAQLFRAQHADFDLILAMTGDQSAVVQAHFSVEPNQVALLGEYAPRRADIAPVALLAPLWADASLSTAHSKADDFDILDPLGGSLEAYEACATRIRRSIFEFAHLIADLK